ncbi:unnamed protein product [Closterium sp. NIES-64]|nr:unnamed protein product [Closterium sp. NIES-64]
MARSSTSTSSLPSLSLPPPAADEPPAAKKVCVAAPPPVPAPSVLSIGVMAALAPLPPCNASGASSGAPFRVTAASAPSPALRRAANPTSPRLSTALGAGAVPFTHAPTPTPSRILRRPRPGPVMPRRRLAVVTLLMPETGADPIRADLIARITAMPKPHFFRRGSVPEFEVATGEPLRVPRRAYARLCFSWPTEEEAEDFKRNFPRSIPLSASRSVLLKVFEDRNPGFTAAKAGGAATLSLRKIPPRYTPEDVRDFLMQGADPSEPAWLADLQFFHRTTDPYEEVFLPIFTGIPLPPPPDDPAFSRIPAVIPFEDDSPPALLNISTHVPHFLSVPPLGQPSRSPPPAPTPLCLSLMVWAIAPQPKLAPSLCPPLSSPYRFHPLPGSLVAAFTPSPSTPPLTSLNTPALPSRYLACPPLLSPPTLLPPGQILGARPAPDAFRKDPGFLFIGLDTDIEPWTCVLCNFTCGPALDSAMAHMASEAHTSNLRAAAKGPAAKEKNSNWRAQPSWLPPRSPHSSPSDLRWSGGYCAAATCFPLML